MNKGKAATVLAVIVALLALAALAVLPQPERNPYKVHEVPAAVEGAAEDVDFDARGDNGLAVGLDGVVWLLKGELGMAAAAHTNRWQLGMVAVLGRKKHRQGNRTRDRAACVADVEHAVAGIGIGADVIARAIRGAQLDGHDNRAHALGGRAIKADGHGVVAIAQAKLLKSR